VVYAAQATVRVWKPLLPHETEHGDQLAGSHRNVEPITGQATAAVHACCVAGAPGAPVPLHAVPHWLKTTGDLDELCNCPLTDVYEKQPRVRVWRPVPQLTEHGVQALASH